MLVLNVVLSEETDAVLELRPGWRRGAEALLRHRVEEKVRKGEAREGTRIVKIVERPGTPREEARLPLAEPAPAELQAVTTLEDRQFFGHLEGLDVVEVVDPAVAEAHHAHGERAKAGDGLATGYPDGRVRVSDAGPVRGAARGLGRA